MAKVFEDSGSIADNPRAVTLLDYSRQGGAKDPEKYPSSKAPLKTTYLTIDSSLFNDLHNIININHVKEASSFFSQYKHNRFGFDVN